MALLRGLKSGMERSALEGLQYPGTAPDLGFTGTLPTTIGELSGWTGTASWTVGFNFQDAAGASVACASMSDGAAMTVSKLTNSPTILTAPQAGWASQGGISIAAANELLFVTDADWDVNATIPTIYMATVSMASGPSSAQEILTGLTGTGSQGWLIEATGASGLRITCMGSASTYVTGSTAFFDGEPHVIAWCIDDAAGKAKLFTEWGTTELTGLTYTQTGSLICTVGPSSTGASWTATAKYFQMARGQHALAYTNAASVVTAYSAILSTGSGATSIVGLPTTLAELNTVLGTITATHAWNLSSLTASPMTGASGSAFQTFTGTMQGSVTGTTPTLSSAPQIKTSFTSQAACFMDSNGDNLWGSGNMPAGNHTGVLIFAAPATHTGSTEYILGKGDADVNDRWWLRSNLSSQLTFDSRDTSGSQTTTATLTGVMTGGGWTVAAWRRGISGERNRLYVSSVSSTASGVIGTAPNDATQQGGLGRPYEATVTTTTSQCKLALWAWVASSTTDADLQTAVNNIRWRYAL